MNIFKWLFSRRKTKITIGLALGSGGAKGFAELGAIKAFEENGIEFDVVAGTSIGSIIGAFYADGYSSTDIFELLMQVDVSDIKNFFMMNMSSCGLFEVIDKDIGSKNIEELKKPFRAIGTEVESGEEKVFEKGSVASALCASSCYPPFFKPVLIDNKRYVDGAFTNSIPADVVKKLGADYVVGIDLRNHEAKPNIISKIFPTYKSKVEKPWQKGYDFSSVMLKPDLKEFTSLSFSQATKIYEEGYRIAILNMPKILKDISDLKNKK
jgi:NTE family protein